MRNLYRSNKDVVIAGVCAGLGEYLEVDPVFIRILFVLFTLAGGAGVLLYILLWLLIPGQSNLAGGSWEESIKSNSEEMKSKVEQVVNNIEKDTDSRNAWGWVVVGAGLFLLLSNLEVFSWFRFDLIWPILLIGLGVYLITKR